MNFITKDEWMEAAVSVLFPRRCPVCDTVIRAGSFICPSCSGKISYIVEPFCKKCGKPIVRMQKEYCPDCERKAHLFRQGRAVFAYRKEMKLSMYRFKYGNRREYADYYAKEAKACHEKWIRMHEIEAIVPVPMYAGKKRLRGYNQAEVFAGRLGRELLLPVEKRMVWRVRNTVPQKELNDRQRKDNLKGAFQLRTNIVKYKKLIVVDDIYTTGNTIDAVAKALKEGGVEQVYFLCICIGEGC